MVFLGKRDASPLKAGTPLLKDLLGAVPAGTIPPTPAHFGHGFDFGTGTGWHMLGNGPDDTVYPGFQGCGDCAWAGPAHEEMEAAKNSGRPIPKFSGKTIVAQYSAYCGYDAHTGENDTGSDPQEVLAWRQTKGLYDDDGRVYKIGQHIALTPGDFHELWSAAWLFETVGIGVQIQQAQEDQFNHGEAWNYVPGSPNLGGHYIPVMGPTGLVSWAQRVGYTQAFYEHLNDESFAYIDPERYSALTGQTAEHFADQDLEKYIALMVQAKAN